jgi:D-alanyl-D-alanine carboxypeptidase
VLALVRVGDETRVVTAGLANVRTKEPMSAAHRFPVASVTKSMVAAVVMQLVEQGTLSLDDTTEDWLPGLLRSDHKITVEQLLSHRSGLPEYVEAQGFASVLRRGSLEPRALIDLVAAQPLEFEPGSSSAYSNTNYIALGLIVEAATDATLEQNLDARIFEPTGMASTSLRGEPAGDEPLVHWYADGKDVTTSNPVALGWADGGVVSTAEDLSRFYRALLSGRLVRPDLVRRMTAHISTIEWAAYGLGLAVTDKGCGTVYGHQGRTLGIFTDAWTLESLDREVVVMVNIGEDVRRTGPIAPIGHAALCG